MSFKSTLTDFVFPKEFGGLFAFQNADTGNLEDHLYLHDFYRADPSWSEERPLVLCKDGGLMAFFTMNGVDPEPFADGDFDEAAVAVRRAMDHFNLEGLEKDFAGGEWEIGNTIIRIESQVPELAPLQRKSEALQFLRKASKRSWANKNILDDRIVWWIRFMPKIRTELDRWKMVDAEYCSDLISSVINAQAEMIRRKARQFEESLIAFTTVRPVQGFGIAWMTTDQIHDALYRIVNRTTGEVPPYDPDVPLKSLVCMSGREIGKGKQRYYKKDEDLCAILTLKNPPKSSRGNALRHFQDKCDFPFWITNIFQPINTTDLQKRLASEKPVADALGQDHWADEAHDFMESLQHEVATPFHWKFSVVITGKDATQLEERMARIGNWVKAVAGAQPMEESGKARVIAELGTIPGNGFMNRRYNLITSKNAGDVAFVYRLRTGRPSPNILFGNRRNGYCGFDMFDSSLPNWNCSVLGGPGSGKSVLMNKLVQAQVGYPSQVYVIDIGNSFSRTFEWLKKEMPGMVTTMRFGADDFSFHPFPLAWAMKERAEQQANGTYKKPLGDGEVLPCPVEHAQIFFASWLEQLLSEGKLMSPDKRNRLDKALKGADGKGGFFLHYEELCRYVVEQKEAHPDSDPIVPEPLSTLLTFIRQDAPEFADAIEYWTRHPQKVFFDSGRDALSGAKAVYFELTGLDDQPLVTRPFVAALMGTVWRRITDPRFLHERKILVIDEAWKFLADPAFATVIEGFFRTIRKFNGFVVLSTQTPDDIQSGEARKLLRTMSHQFLYKGFNDPDYFKTHLRMTPHQMELHGSLVQDDLTREVLHWDQNGNTRVYRVELDAWEYWTVTTYAGDKVLWNRFAEFYKDEAATLEALASATGHKTIISPSLRHRLVEEYARKHGIA